MRNSEEYYADIVKMKPNLFIGGDKVRRDDPRIAPGIKVVNITFNLAREPQYEALLTVKSPLSGQKINRFTHLPQNPYDLLQKQKMIRLMAQRAGGCIQRCMGYDALIALSIGTKEIDEKCGTEYHSRFMQYLQYYQKRDLVATCAQTDVKGDRLRRPHEQPDPDSYVHIVDEKTDGIIVRGAKHCITMAAYADELIVIPTRALGEADKDYAVAFAIPADYEGISLITRPVWLRQRKQITSPFADMGVSDSMIIFHDVFVPKERIFMCREWEFGRRIALLFADSHRHSYSGCKPAISDILCGATALAAEANNIDKVAHVRQKMSEFVGSAELSYAAGIAAAIYGEKTSSGTFFPNSVYANVGRRLTGETIYHEYNILTEIAGGLMVTLPFEEDFFNEETRAYLEKYIMRNPEVPPEIAHRIWRFIENVATSAMANWYQIAGVHGGGSPIMETIALNTEYDYDSRKKLARYLAGIDTELDQSKILAKEPIDIM